MNRVIALGFFDGVHFGHQALLARAGLHAARLGLPSLALSLDRHPDALLRGTAPPLLLTSKQRKARLMASGMEEVFLLPFDKALQELPWEGFIQNVLIDTFHAAYVVCGESYRFGWRGEGTPEKLYKKCMEANIGCEILPTVMQEGCPVSSTRIRSLLSSGQIEKANALLGYAYALSGRVCHGNALGRTLGAPTANVQPDPALALPQTGVYITKVHCPGGCYPAVTNLGCRPTLDGGALCMESFLQGFEGDLYGQEITVEFYRFLRPERRFSGLSELKKEIMRDAMAASGYFTQEALQ